LNDQVVRNEFTKSDHVMIFNERIKRVGNETVNMCVHYILYILERQKGSGALLGPLDFVMSEVINEGTRLAI